MPTSTRGPRSELRPPPRRPPSTPADTAGFTLLELAIVLLVVAIAASFVIPRLRSTDDAALAASASRLATTVRLLYEEAAFRHVPIRLNLDLDKHTYWVTVWSQDPERPEFVPDTTLLAQPVRLPDAVAFLDVVLPAFGTATDGVVFAQFWPEGYADPLVVHLKNRQGAYATLALDPLTGRTRVGDGRIDLRAPGTPGGRRRPSASTG